MVHCNFSMYQVLAVSLRKKRNKNGNNSIFWFGQKSPSFCRMKRLCSNHFEILKNVSLFVVSLTCFSMSVRRLRSSSLVQKLKRNQIWIVHVLFWSVISLSPLCVHGFQLHVRPLKLFMYCCNGLNAMIAALLRYSERRDGEMLGAK